MLLSSGHWITHQSEMFVAQRSRTWLIADYSACCAHRYLRLDIKISRFRGMMGIMSDGGEMQRDGDPVAQTAKVSG